MQTICAKYRNEMKEQKEQKVKKEKQTAPHYSWWTNFMIGVMATAVGVGLTFGVNNLVEYQHHRQAQRQAAMMAIYDIDEIIRQFNEFKQRDDAFFKVTMYMYTHQDELETVAMDSLWMTAEYLTFSASEIPEWADESTEKVFTTSMDALQNIADITFCDNVQECYQRRRQLLLLLTSNVTYKRPISEEFVLEYRKHVPAANMDYAGMMNQKAMAGLVRKMFSQPEVPLFLQKYLLRDRDYSHFIYELVRRNMENKFIMNVKDDEIAAYVEKHINKTMPAKPKLLVGEWDARINNQQKTYTFRPNHSALSITQMEYRIGIYVEQEDVNVYMLAPLTYTIDGTWELDGDSLHLDFDPQTLKILSFDLDLNYLPKTALERAKDSLDARKQQYKEVIRQQLQAQANWSWSNKVSLGQSGQIMFWEESYAMPWGQILTEKSQLLKVE